MALFLYDDREGFCREAEPAVEPNPHNPAAVGFIGWARALYGDWKPGLALLKEAMGLNRLFPGWYRIAVKPDFPVSARRLIGFLVKTDDCFESLPPTPGAQKQKGLTTNLS